MITYAPLPTVSEIAAALTSQPLRDADAYRPWCRLPDTAFGFSRGAWGLAALAAERAAHLGRAPRFWLPDYFCNQALAALRQTGASLFFYPVTDDLVPDWPAVSAEAEVRPPDVLVVVHYFGRATDLEVSRRFADRSGALLLEDAAHVALPGTGVGQHGDAVLYSPHKWLAVPDGAILVTRVSARLSHDLPAGPHQGVTAAVPWLCKRLLQKAIPMTLVGRLRPHGPAELEDDPPLSSPGAVAAMQNLSRMVLGRSNFPRILERRRANLACLTDVFARYPGVHPWSGLASAAPYRLVLRGDAQSLAGLYRRLRGRGLPVESWPDLPPEVSAAPDRHRIALQWRRGALFIPIHQTASTVRLEAAYAAAIRE